MTDILRVLDEIEAHDKAATSGPWRIEATGTGPGETRNILGPCGDDEIMVADIHAWNVPDAALISHFRASCPRVARALRIALSTMESIKDDVSYTVEQDILEAITAIEKELGAE